MVASTRESVTKVLNEMRNRGIIEIEGGRITLKDWRRPGELSRV
jgi:CRP-like cAMP-binding protein